MQLVAGFVPDRFRGHGIGSEFQCAEAGATVVLVGALLAIGVLGLLVFALLQRLPHRYRVVLLVSARPWLCCSWPPRKDWRGFALPMVLCLLAGCTAAVSRPRAIRWQLQQRQVAAVGLLLGVSASRSAVRCLQRQGAQRIRVGGLSTGGPHTCAREPGLPGKHEVKTWSYGSGKDRHRLVNCDGGDVRRTFGRSLQVIDNWDGLRGRLRTSFWGFDAPTLPLQARVSCRTARAGFPSC